MAAAASTSLASQLFCPRSSACPQLSGLRRPGLRHEQISSTSDALFHHLHTQLRISLPTGRKACCAVVSMAGSWKVKFGGIPGGRSNFLDVKNNLSQEIEGPTWQSHQCYGVRKDSLFPAGVNQETEGFILNAVSMNFFERLSLAWRILFPTATTRMNSNANIAKQRLKMILFSDRCAVNDEAKQKIISNIVGALSDFVEIDSQEKVQLSVSTDPDLGTVYSVMVPVRRVKPEFQDYDEYRGITNVEYKDTGGESGTVDVRFDFFVPNEKESFGF